MRRRWKRVAECADNQTFEPEDISNAIIPALEQDCTNEMSPEFISGLCIVCHGQESSLFKNDLGPQLESLRSEAGSGIGRVVLDHAIQISAGEKIEGDMARKALTNALTDRAARGARQVEEHYCRESTTPRANRVRERIEQAVSHADMDGLARQILNREQGRSARPPLKRQGLDDGVKL
jgi:hypothetical protein